MWLTHQTYFFRMRALVKGTQFVKSSFLAEKYCDSLSKARFHTSAQRTQLYSTICFGKILNSHFLKLYNSKVNQSQPAALIMSDTDSPPPPQPRVGLKLPEDVKARKDKYLDMPQEEKRSLYKCREKFVTLAKICDWKKYFVDNKVQAITTDSDEEKEKYPADEGLSSRVSLWQGDITALEIDSIVNAANSSLLGGGGGILFPILEELQLIPSLVDGAIHRAAGGYLVKECRELRGCAAGQAKITGGYKLPSKHVIHTVGPQGEKPDVLRSCYENSLQLMLENDLRSIAFPCIATGIYGYPNENAANVALTTVRKFLENNSDKVDRVIFTVFLEEDKQIYEKLMQKYFPLQ